MLYTRHASAIVRYLRTVVGCPTTSIPSVHIVVPRKSAYSVGPGLDVLAMTALLSGTEEPYAMERLDMLSRRDLLESSVVRRALERASVDF